jgi:hypothetical protein
VRAVLVVVPEVGPKDLAGLLGDPGAVRVSGHPAKVDSADVELDEEQDVQPLEPHRVDGEAIAGSYAGGLLAQEARQVLLARRGAGSSPCRRSVVRIAVAETYTPSRCGSP